MKVQFSHCILLLILFVVSFVPLRAQIPETPPAQVYVLDAHLDPAAGTLDVEYDLRYRNVSRDTLYELIIHIWANAFSQPGSAFGKQKLMFDDAEFYFTKSSDRIQYRFLQFSEGPEFLKHEPVGPDPDIIRITLRSPLLPDGEVTLHADYQLGLPSFHSRLGTDGQIWQLAHWFPKPARYVDHQWMAIPYLELGEFIQDFATYRVSLTLPDSFVVVSTGAPADDATRQHRELALERSRNDVPGLSGKEGWRTWVFDAGWVPDVALACSPHYLLREEAFPLADGRVVIGQCAHTLHNHERWKEALTYVRQSTRFYDQHVGPYPWPYVSAVEAVKQFSGGMEYPMITYIQPGLPPSALEEVIAHEIGHNWFYGVLSTNERDQPWMDEGLNSYYDHRYTASHQSSRSMSLSVNPEDWLVYGEAGKRLLPIPADGVRHLHSEIDYQTGAYTIPSRALDLLEQLHGQDAVDQAFQGYYQRWKFDHPRPEDLQTSLESQFQIRLDWLFNEALSKPFVRDLSIREIKRIDNELQVRVKQRGLCGAPWALHQVKDPSSRETVWYPGFRGKDTTVFIVAGPDVKSLSVQGGVPDLHPANDQVRLNGWFPRKSGWGLGIGAGVIHATKFKTYILPVVGLNVYDGFQAGLALHNQKMYYQPAGFFAGGLYGFRSKRIGYTGSVYQDIYFRGGPDLIRLALKVRSAGYYAFGEETLSFHRFNPSIEWQSRAEMRTTETHWRVGLFGWLISRQKLDYSQEIPDVDDDLAWDRILSFRSTVTHRDPLLPWSIHFDAEYQPYTDGFRREQAYLKTGLELNLATQFMHKRFFRVRAFVGGFPYNTRREAGNVSNPSARGSFALSFQGVNDYRFEEPFIGRSEQTGFSSQQILIREGGFKTALGPAFGQGQSNHLISAINIRSDLPLGIRLPVQIYSDLGYWSDRTFLGQNASFSDQVWWDMGLQVSLLDDRLQVFFPVVQNNNLHTLLKQRGPSYWSRITWSINLNLIQLPWDFPSLF